MRQWFCSENASQKKKSALKHHGPRELSWFLASVFLLATVSQWLIFQGSTQKNLFLFCAFLPFSLPRCHPDSWAPSITDSAILDCLCVCVFLCHSTHCPASNRHFRKQKLNEIKWMTYMNFPSLRFLTFIQRGIINQEGRKQIIFGYHWENQDTYCRCPL